MPDNRKPKSYSIAVGPDMPTIEVDYLHCVHCGLAFPKPQHAKEAAEKSLTPLEVHFYEMQGKRIPIYCAKCNGYICSVKCEGCTPMEAQLEIAEGSRNPTAVSVGMGGIVMPPPLAPM